MDVINVQAKLKFVQRILTGFAIKREDRVK